MYTFGARVSGLWFVIILFYVTFVLRSECWGPITSHQMPHQTPKTEFRSFHLFWGPIHSFGGLSLGTYWLYFLVLLESPSEVRVSRLYTNRKNFTHHVSKTEVWNSILLYLTYPFKAWVSVCYSEYFPRPTFKSQNTKMPFLYSGLESTRIIDLIELTVENKVEIYLPGG